MTYRLGDLPKMNLPPVHQSSMEIDAMIRFVTSHDRDDSGQVVRYCECEFCRTLEARPQLPRDIALRRWREAVDENPHLLGLV